MKPSTLLLAFLSVAALTGCSTAYKTGQTPDDVYYSAAKPQTDSDDKEDKEVKEDRTSHVDEQYYDDRFLRMKVRNRHLWSELDDWYYYDKYSSAFSYYYGSYNNPYTSWNYYYNPYCCCHTTYFPSRTIKYNNAPPVVKRNFNLAGYTNTNYNSGGSYKAPTIKTSNRTYNNTNNSSFSEKVKDIFTKDNSGSSRTYTPTTSSGGGNNGGSSGGSGSSGGGGKVSRPVR